MAQQTRLLRAELQSRDTVRFLERAQQALFEELLAERVWALCDSEAHRFAEGVPLAALWASLERECLDHGVCDGQEGAKSVHQRLLTLTKLHASYADDL